MSSNVFLCRFLCVFVLFSVLSYVFSASFPRPRLNELYLRILWSSLGDLRWFPKRFLCSRMNSYAVS